MDGETKFERLCRFEKTWPSEMGGWFPGREVIFRGQSLLADLHRLPWMGLLVYAITGKIPDECQVKLFEGIWVISTSFPDPRLWNNRVAALAGSARSTTTLGVSAAIAVSEATIYGHRPLLAASEFLAEVGQREAAGEELESILLGIYGAGGRGSPGCGKQRDPAKIPGFGRPVTPVDERLGPLLSYAQELGCGSGEAVQLAFRIEDCLQLLGLNLRMNVASLMAALCSDQGMRSRQFYHFVTLCFSGGILACAIDAEQHPEGSFFPMRCDALCYKGGPRREWRTSC